MVVLRAVHRRFARFGVEALQQVGRFVPGLIFDLLESESSRASVRRQARHSLELSAGGPPALRISWRRRSATDQARGRPPGASRARPTSLISRRGLIVAR